MKEHYSKCPYRPLKCFLNGCSALCDSPGTLISHLSEVHGIVAKRFPERSFSVEIEIGSSRQSSSPFHFQELFFCGNDLFILSGQENDSAVCWSLSNSLRYVNINVSLTVEILSNDQISPSAWTSTSRCQHFDSSKMWLGHPKDAFHSEDRIRLRISLTQ